jgi:hypothetical protein
MSGSGEVGISLPSAQSLLIELRFGGTFLATATAFVADSARGPVLLTNRHNVTGRNNDTNAPMSPTGGVPDELLVFHHVQNQLGVWVAQREPLYGRNGSPLWREHPTLGARMDAVALPLTQLRGVQPACASLSGQARW